MSKFNFIIILCLGFLTLVSCVNRSIDPNSKDFNEGLDLYSRIRLPPTEINYAADTVYVGIKQQFWNWKNKFIKKYGRNGWDQFVILAKKNIGAPDPKLTIDRMLEYQIETVMR